MVSIELTKEDIEKIILMMESSTVQLVHAKELLAVYNKFKEAKDL